ncbi:hypothetical protein NL676_000665 [Syzygium grande]|nr:hypothetical protein NL676_000665 [Syzygium grande]
MSGVFKLDWTGLVRKSCRFYWRVLPQFLPRIEKKSRNDILTSVSGPDDDESGKNFRKLGVSPPKALRSSSSREACVGKPERCFLSREREREREREMDGGNGSRMWKTLKQRLGFKRMGCCGAPTWTPSAPTILTVIAEPSSPPMTDEYPDQERERDRAAMHASDVPARDADRAPPPPLAGMNLAAALEAERNLGRGLPAAGPGVKTLMRLIEETDGVDLKQGRRRRRGDEGTAARKKGSGGGSGGGRGAIGCAACAWTGIRARRLSPAATRSVGCARGSCGSTAGAAPFATVRSLRFLTYFEQEFFFGKKFRISCFAKTVCGLARTWDSKDSLHSFGGGRNF